MLGLLKRCLFLISLLESLGLFRFLELLRVLRLLRLQFNIVINTLSVIALSYHCDACKGHSTI
jgi:hypothetical protein